MEKKIAEEIGNLIKKKLSDNAQINAFIKADEEFQKLINEGLTTKRGFNIMTTEEIYNPTSHFTYSQSLE